ncbi:hypothetical protein MKW92_029355, partial [Papaver armeniacum]
MKRNNSFLVKEFGNGNQMVQFSKEPLQLLTPSNTLVSKQTTAGLANAKTVSVQAGKDSGVVLATTKTNKQNNPSALVHKTVMKKEFSRRAKALANQ